MNYDEFAAAMQSGDEAESLAQWAPRVAAILLTLTTLDPEMLSEHPDEVLDFLRQVTAKMPTEVFIAATIGLQQVQEVMSTPGVTPEMIEEVESLFKGFEKPE